VSLVVKLLKMMNRKLWALDLSKSKQAEQIRAERLRNQRSSNGNESFSGKNVGFLRPKFWELARIAKTIPHVAVEEGWGSILFKGWLLTSRLWCRTLTLSLPQSFPSHHLIPPPALALAPSTHCRFTTREGFGLSWCQWGAPEVLPCLLVTLASLLFVYSPFCFCWNTPSVAYFITYNHYFCLFAVMPRMLVSSPNPFR
jgi:hypothetical protein